MAGGGFRCDTIVQLWLGLACGPRSVERSRSAAQDFLRIITAELCTGREAAMALFCFVCNGVREEYLLDWENVFVGTDSFVKLRKVPSSTADLLVRAAAQEAQIAHPEKRNQVVRR